MDLLFILLLCILASSKVTVQGLFAKKNVKNVADGVLFNGLIFLFSALLFAKNAAVEHWSIAAFGAPFGILTVVFQLSYIKAISLGNVSLTVMMVNLSMIIPIGLSIAVYGEKLTPLRILGIILTVVAIVISVDRGQKSNSSKKWLFLSIAAALANGALAICQKTFGHTAYSHHNQAFVAWSYITATVASVLLFALLKVRGARLSYKLKPAVFLFAVAAGVILGVFQAFYTRAVANIDGVLLFPTFNGGALILSTLSGVLLLGDRLKPNQIVSIAVGVAAIIVMNI